MSRSNLFIKRIVIAILAKVADFVEFKKDEKMQENLIRGIMTIFASDGADNNDLCLK